MKEKKGKNISAFIPNIKMHCLHNNMITLYLIAGHDDRW